MHEHLADFATRLARSGINRVDAIERALIAEFEVAHDPNGDWGDPQEGRLDARIAQWAVAGRIAEREGAVTAGTSPTTASAGRRRHHPDRDLRLRPRGRRPRGARHR